MGLGESDASVDMESAIACSICLEMVTGGGDRSTARLQCGHEFHLDCIGSAFNAKGVMQCPNCRKVEKGNWLYANGSRSLPELSFDEWTHDEDLYDISYAEMTFGIHWCPFRRLARLQSSFEFNSRLAGSIASSLVPPYLTNSRPHGHVRVHPYPPAPRGAMFSDSQRQGPMNGLPPVGPTPPALPDQATYYLFPPTASSSQGHQDVEGAGDPFYSWERDPFYSWERDRFAPFPLLPVPINREPGWWRPVPHSSSSSDSGSRARFWHRNGPDMPLSRGRTDASSYRPPHSTRTRHFI